MRICDIFERIILWAGSSDPYIWLTDSDADPWGTKTWYLITEELDEEQ